MDPISCDPCHARSRSIQADYWCPFCAEAFCKLCCQFHQTMKLTRTHNIQRISEISAQEKQQRTNNRKLQFEELTTKTFNEKTQLKEMDNLLVLLDGLADTALNLKKLNFNMKMKTEQRKAEAMRKVGVFKTRLKRLADEIEDQCASDLDYLQSGEYALIESRIEDCESIFSAIELSKDLTQDMKLEVVTPNTLHKVNSTRKRCAEFKASLQRVHSQMLPVKYNLHIDRNVAEALNNMPSIIGKIEVAHDDIFDVANDHRFQPQSAMLNRAHSGKSVTSSKSVNQISMDSVRAQKLHEIYLQQNSDTDEPTVTSIKAMDSGNFLTLDRNNDKLVVYRPDGVSLTQYVFTSQIWDLAFIDEKTAAVTVPETETVVIIKFRDGAIFAEKLVKAGSVCYGICAIQGHLVVTAKGGMVKILTLVGEEIASIRKNSEGDNIFKDPQYVIVNATQDEIYVTDKAHDTVIGLCLAGVIIVTKPKFTFSHAELKSPTGICLDSQGNIYVSGVSSHNVVQLTSQGKLLQILLTGLVNPQTLCLSTSEDRLLVSSLCPGKQSKHMENVIEVFRMF